MIGGLGGGLAGLGAVVGGANAGTAQAADALTRLLYARQAQQDLEQQQQWQQYAGPIWKGLQQVTGGQQATGQDIASAASGYQPGAVQSYPMPSIPPQTFSQPQAQAPTGAPPALQRQILNLEGNKDYAVGKAGELGPGQILPSTGKQYGYQPTQLVGQSGRQASGQIVSDLYRRSGGDSAATLVGYNRGPGAMARFQAAGDNAGAVQPALAPAYQRAVQQDIAQKTQRIGQMAGPQVAQGTQGIAYAALQTIDPASYGRQQLAATMQAIEQAAPDAPGAVKFMALGMISKILQPADQMALKLQMEQTKNDLRLAIQELKGDQGAAAANVRAVSAEAGLGERTRHDLAMEQIDRNKQTASATAEKLEASKPFDVVDDKGKVVRSIMARERRDQPGFIDSESGQPIKLEQGQHLKQITPSTSGGGRAGAQIIRQEVGGREVLSDLQNAVSLPVGTTIGPLGTVHPGTSVLGALQGDLVRKITDQDSQLMQASMASMTRELSILMSPVYGGNWAAQQIDPLVPKTGDTLGTVLFKLARLAQSADNALEAVSKSPILSNEQQQYANDLKSEIGQAIPWTPAQALEFSHRGQGPQQSFGDFVGKNVTGATVPSVDDQGNVIPPKSDKRSEAQGRTQMAGDVVPLRRGDTPTYPYQQAPNPWIPNTPEGYIEMPPFGRPGGLWRPENDNSRGLG